MKKTKKFIVTVLVAFALSTSVWASTGAVVGDSWLGTIYTAVVAALTGDDDCKLKVCQTCNTGQPNCRPSSD